MNFLDRFFAWVNATVPVKHPEPAKAAPPAVPAVDYAGAYAKVWKAGALDRWLRGSLRYKNANPDDAPDDARRNAARDAYATAIYSNVNVDTPVYWRK